MGGKICAQVDIMSFIHNVKPFIYLLFKIFSSIVVQNKFKVTDIHLGHAVVCGVCVCVCFK